VHKVQLLDVATGTGTFLAEAVKQIYKRYKGQEGVWSSYVENDLLPRLHGFELLMASYAMCHMKLDLLLQETGYKPPNTTAPPRLSVYLTNSLEEHHPEMDTLFASWLSKEANDASWIKKNMPIMVAFGNPPYSGESSNKGDWILKIMEDYKKEPGGKIKLQERNAKWLNDDYVKFIRQGEYYIEKNGEGVLAYITNHSYLDNPTFRGMRWHLLNTFDDIYVLDLHGSTQRREVTPDGKPDKNVFDIQQGVSIIIAVKKNQAQKGLANLYHSDFWGDRKSKYDRLNASSVNSINWEKLSPSDNQYLFVPRDNSLYEKYEAFLSVDELFTSKTTGIVTARDALTIHERKEDLIKTIKDFSLLDVEDARQKYSLGKDVRDWSVSGAQQDLLKTNLDEDLCKPILYRLFDKRWTYYTGKSKGFLCMPRGEVMKHFHRGENIGLITARSNKSGRPDHFFLSKYMSEAKTGESSTQSIIIPLYRYESTMGELETKISNFDPKIYSKIKETIPNIKPESLFDYIYAVLHSPSYRDRYAEFLKSDFPRIPYPDDVNTFNALVEKGAELRSYRDGKVYINETQYFGGVPAVAWEFYIGGYQPAQKWLKDRKGRELSVDDIMHYQRIIVALTNTDRIMKEIDKIDFLPDN